MITIVFAEPGRGKTAYLTCNAATFLNRGPISQELYESTCAYVESLNAEGFNYSLPDHAPVYTNYRVGVSSGWNEITESYYVDGFHLGFPNKYLPVFNVYPGSKIFLSEAQRYYNSRMSTYFPEWVSRWFEEHRHFDLDIWLDVQRPALIDINIRDIAERFVQILQVRLQRCETAADRHWQTVFDTVVYNSYADVESGNGTPTTEVLDFNVFEYYESQSYFRSFLPSAVDVETLDDAEGENFVRKLLAPGDFHRIKHVGLADVENNLLLKQFMYRQTPPKKYFVKRSSAA